MARGTNIHMFLEAKRVRRSASLGPEDLPSHPAHSFKTNFIRCSVADAFLQTALKNAQPITVDFDLVVAYFLHETAGMKPKPGDIPDACDKIIADFALGKPSVGRQSALLASALHIQSVVKHYFANPTSPKPFALRCPNLATLKRLSAERGRNPVRLSDTETHILLDLYGRTLAIGLPPKRIFVAPPVLREKQAHKNFESGEVSGDVSYEVRALKKPIRLTEESGFGFYPGPGSHRSIWVSKGPPTTEVLWTYDKDGTFGHLFN